LRAEAAVVGKYFQRLPRRLVCRSGSRARSIVPGWMIDSLTVEEKSDQPLLKAPIGFSCTSKNVGTARDER